MKRRTFIAGLGGAAAWPVAARAQPRDRVRMVGVIAGFAPTDAEGRARIEALQHRLRERGWVEGRNIRFEERLVEASSPSQLQAAAAELVRLAPDAILANGARAVSALLKETRSIPIVFATITDPVGQGFVRSLSRPGGNVTGFSQYDFMAGKLLEVLKEIAPTVVRLAYAHSPTLIGVAESITALNELAPSFGTSVVGLPIRTPSEIAAAFKAFAMEANGGVIVAPDAQMQMHRRSITEAATLYRLPAIYTDPIFVTDGGLVSYGVDRIEQYRQAAGYIDRILRGEKPAELPVQLPTKFVLAINSKAAKALGLTVPPMLLALADEVIE